MMLNYTTNKNIVIEARESCRVPVPVERCPLFRRDQHKDDDDKDQMSKYFSSSNDFEYCEINFNFQFHRLSCA